MKKNSIIVPSDRDFGAVCISAVRYCLGRQSYMPGLVQGFLRPLLPHFSDNDLSVMQRDIEEAEKWGGYGDERIDKPGWIRFLSDISSEITKRKEAATQQ